MESPEKRNANSKDAPSSCQAGYSIYFRGRESGKKTAAPAAGSASREPEGAPRAYRGPERPGHGEEEPRGQDAPLSGLRLLGAVDATGCLGYHLQPGLADILTAALAYTISAGRNTLECRRYSPDRLGRFIADSIDDLVIFPLLGLLG